MDEDCCSRREAISMAQTVARRTISFPVRRRTGGRCSRSLVIVNVVWMLLRRFFVEKEVNFLVYSLSFVFLAAARELKQ
jgi:hypothetical protein